MVSDLSSCIWKQEKEQRGFIRRLWGNVAGLGHERVELVRLGLLLGALRSQQAPLLPLSCTKLKPQA